MWTRRKDDSMINYSIIFRNLHCSSYVLLLSERLEIYTHKIFVSVVEYITEQKREKIYKLMRV